MRYFVLLSVLLLLLCFVVIDCDGKKVKKKQKHAADEGVGGSKGKKKNELFKELQSFDQMKKLIEAGDAAMKEHNATKALEYYDRALDVAPNEPRAHFKRGIALMQLDEEDSMDSFRQAWKLYEEREDYVQRTDQAPATLRHDILNNLAILLSNKQQYAEAFQKLKQSHEKQAAPRSYANFVALSQALCEWDEWDEMMQTMASFVGHHESFVAPGAAIIFPLNASCIMESARHVGFVSDIQISNLPQPNLPIHPPPKSPSIPLRVGFLGSIFYDSVLARAFNAVFLQKPAGITLYLFQMHAGDPSAKEWSPVNNALQERLVKCEGMTATDIAIEINRRIIRVLVDLEGLSSTVYDTHKEVPHRVMSFRPAQHQVNYPMKFPASTQAFSTLYMFADKIAVPPEYSSHFKEKMLLFPGSFVVSSYTKLPFASKPSSRSDNGLPTAKNSTIISSFNTQAKLNPHFMQQWMRILDRLPDSVLWLYSLRAPAMDNLKAWAQQRGIAPKRIIPASFQPFEEHIGRIAHAHLHLDTQANGIATALDMLWKNVSFVTSPGDKLVERTVASIALAAGYPEFVAQKHDYVDVAVRLLKNKVSASKSKTGVFNVENFANNLAKLIRMMWQLDRSMHVIMYSP